MDNPIGKTQQDALSSASRPAPPIIRRFGPETCPRAISTFDIITALCFL
jgi:hypothetical protein